MATEVVLLWVVAGQSLERLAREAVQQQWRAEVRARENERDLLASLEAEEAESEDAVKRKSKKLKKKEKERKRKQEEAMRKKEMEGERERELQARSVRPAVRQRGSGARLWVGGGWGGWFRLEGRCGACLRATAWTRCC